jgi:hypothetical protein
VIAVTSFPPEDRPPIHSHDPAHPSKARRGQALTIAILLAIVVGVVLVLLL